MKRYLNHRRQIYLDPSELISTNTDIFKVKMLKN